MITINILATLNCCCFMCFLLLLRLMGPHWRRVLVIAMVCVFPLAISWIVSYTLVCTRYLYIYMQYSAYRIHTLINKYVYIYIYTYIHYIKCVAKPRFASPPIPRWHCPCILIYIYIYMIWHCEWTFRIIYIYIDIYRSIIYIYIYIYIYTHILKKELSSQYIVYERVHRAGNVIQQIE
jgi:hypothetical protein